MILVQERHIFPASPSKFIIPVSRFGDIHFYSMYFTLLKSIFLFIIFSLIQTFLSNDLGLYVPVPIYNIYHCTHLLPWLDKVLTVLDNRIYISAFVVFFQCEFFKITLIRRHIFLPCAQLLPNCNCTVCLGFYI